MFSGLCISIFKGLTLVLFLWSTGYPRRLSFLGALPQVRFFLFPVSYGFESPRDFRTFFNTVSSSVSRFLLLLSVSISFGSVSSGSESPGYFGTFFYAGSSSQFFVFIEDFGVLFIAGSSFSLSESSRSMLRNSGGFSAFLLHVSSPRNLLKDHQRRI